MDNDIFSPGSPILTMHVMHAIFASGVPVTRLDIRQRHVL
jgi:hypothetical protein